MGLLFRLPRRQRLRQTVSWATVCWYLRAVSRMTKGTSLGGMLLELIRQQPLQRLIGAEGLAVFPDAAEPVGLGGVVGQPGVGAGEHQQAAAAQAGAMSAGSGRAPAAGR
jgi:hypothetical protein